MTSDWYSDLNRTLTGQGLGLWLSRCHPWEQIQEQCVLRRMVILVPVSLLARYWVGLGVVACKLKKRRHLFLLSWVDWQPM